MSVSNIQHSTPTRLELRFAPDGGSGEISGLAWSFSVLDSAGTIIKPGAFTRSLQRRGVPSMLWQHDAAQPIGSWSDVREDRDGLRVKGTLNLETTQGREAYALAKQGALDGLSIGFAIPPGGQTREDGNKVITEIDLWEISLVTFPANPAARITDVKSAPVLTGLPDLEKLLRNAGLPKAAARRAAAGGWPALAKPDDDFDDLLNQLKKFNQKVKELKNG
jgi:HK97 family phage prohead protease